MVFIDKLWVDLVERTGINQSDEVMIDLFTDEVRLAELESGVELGVSWIVMYVKVMNNNNKND